jgi:hypothetical protein
VKEQSHKREMGAALRGDFERLRARRGASTQAVRAREPGPTAGVQVDMGVAQPVEAASFGSEPRVSWLERLLRRG